MGLVQLRKVQGTKINVGGEFTPQKLFTGNISGAWYDPSDLTPEKVAWRRNLLTYTQDFDNTAWTKNNSSTVTANAAVAPDGTPTADLYVPSTVSGGQYLQQLGATGTTNGYSVWSLYVKASGYNVVQMYSFGIANVFANFDVATGTVGLSFGVQSATMQNVGNGWYRCIMIWGPSLNASVRFAVVSSSTSVRAENFTGDGTSGVLLWGAQVEYATNVSAYQRLTNFTSEFQLAYPDHTLFTDSIATTPLTSLGQSVGAILDKSRPFIRGSEILNNNNFSTDTLWYKAPGVTISDSKMILTNVSGALVFASQSLSAANAAPIIPAIYECAITIDSISSGGIQFSLTNGGVTSAVFSVAGTYKCILYTVGGTGTILHLRSMAPASTLTTAVISSVSIKRITNIAFPLTQGTAASQPILDARTNLLTYTEQFDNAAWAKTFATASANTVTAPDGTLTADTLSWTNTTSNIQQGVTFISGSTYTFSVYMRTVTGSRTVSIGNINAGVTTDVTVTSDWQRFSVTQVASDTLRYPTITSNIGGGGSSIYIWGAQVELGNTATTYQRVVTATNYADIGAPRRLVFDGVNDSLGFLATFTSIRTGSLDLTNTNKVSIFTGITKNSDATEGVVLEIGSAITGSTNSGSFLLTAPGSASQPSYNFSNKGTIQVDNTVTTYTAPVTSVITALGDIGTSTNIVRVNGLVAGSVTSSQGTGNYTSSQVYVGRRNNATNPFNGSIYQLIIRGAESNQNEIRNTEQWIAQKTGITLG